MMLLSSFLSTFLLSIVEARVTFENSEVLDDVDLRGVTTAAFKCYAGCRVYSPTRLDTIVVEDSTGKQYKTLMELGDLKPGKPYDLPANAAFYQLRNKGNNASPSFVFYVVQKGAMNYDTMVAYVLSASRITVRPSTGSLLTIMSTSGAIRFTNFVGDYTGALPSVYTTGFDSVSTAGCRPVYQAISAPSVPNTSFPVYSPIATIDFKKAGEGRSVLITGEQYTLTATGTDESAVYASPGYVGCTKVGDQLYTSVPSNIVSFDSSFGVKDSNGLSVVIEGDYSIANQADALTLTVNDDVQKLSGTKAISQTKDATSFQIGVKWAKKDGSKDRFALQIDVLKSDKVPTTTKSGQSLVIGSSLVMILCSSLLRMSV